VDELNDDDDDEMLKVSPSFSRSRWITAKWSTYGVLRRRNVVHFTLADVWDRNKTKL